MALDAVQWLAMAVTLMAAWLVASQQPARRRLGFWAYLLSNVLWTIWGWSADAYALIVLQFGLAALNMRGVGKNDGERAAA